MVSAKNSKQTRHFSSLSTSTSLHRLENCFAKTLYFEVFFDELDSVMTSISVGSLQNFTSTQQLVSIIETDNTTNIFEAI